MKKTLTALLILTSLSAYSQSESLDQLAQDVKQLINTSADQLDANDQLQVRKNLRQIINVFKVNGHGVPSNRSFFCDSGNNQLIDGDSGKLIHDFNDFTACSEALANVKAGKSFCDYGDNRLYTPAGNLVHDFSDSTTCKDAIATIHRSGKFCDYSDNTLRGADGRLIHDFSSREDCARNL